MGDFPPPIFPHIFPIFPPYFLWGNRCTGVLLLYVTYLPTLQHNIFDVSLTHEHYMVVSPYKKGKPADVLVWAERRVTL